MAAKESNPFKIYQLTNTITGLGADMPRHRQAKMVDALLKLNKEIKEYTQVNGVVRGQHSNLAEQVRELTSLNATLRNENEEIKKGESFFTWRRKTLD